jgi:hypothetical protein
LGAAEIEDRLKLAHEVNLAALFEDVHAFARGLLRFAVEIGGTLLEL